MCSRLCRERRAVGENIGLKSSSVSQFRVPSRLPLLSCHVRQLVVWAISADREAGLHGSRADSSPPVAHFPSPICPCVLLLAVSRLFCPCSCLHVESLPLPVPLFPCAAGPIARRSSSSCGPQTLLWNLRFLTSVDILFMLFYVLDKNKVFYFFHTLHLSPSSPTP